MANVTGFTEVFYQTHTHLHFVALPVPSISLRKVTLRMSTQTATQMITFEETCLELPPSIIYQGLWWHRRSKSHTSEAYDHWIRHQTFFGRPLWDLQWHCQWKEYHPASPTPSCSNYMYIHIWKCPPNTKQCSLKTERCACTYITLPS